MQRVLLAFLLTTCSLAFAQLENGAIVGTVLDSEGQPIPGLTITAFSDAIVDRKISASTDSAGRYRFPAIPPGVYVLKAELKGFSTQQREARVFVGDTVTFDFQMEVEGVAEVIEVSDSISPIDATSSAIQHTVPTEAIESLPKFNSVLDLMKLTPGVGDLDLVAYGAAGESANAYWYDGVDVRSPASGRFVVLPNYEWIEEVQVVGLGAPAEYGGFTGVIGNFVTRSGGNTFHGLIQSFFSNESLVSENVPDPSPQENSKLIDTSAQLGGPILQDKLWFFSGFQYFYDQRDPFGFPEATTTTQPRVFAKLTYKINTPNTLQGSAYYDHLAIDNDGADANTLPEAAANSHGGALSWNATWLSVLSSDTYLEARFGGYDNGGFDIVPKNDGTPGHIDAVTGISSVNFLDTEHLVRRKLQANAAVSHYADHYIGQHDFKFGVEFERSTSDSFYQYNGNRLYLDKLSAPYYRYLWSGPYILNNSIHRTSTFAQDSWKPQEKLTFNVGVRWDHIRGIAANQTIPFDPVAPRLGFTYDIKGNGKTILKAHYGHYYDGFFVTYLNLFNDYPTQTLQIFDSGQWFDIFTTRPINSLNSLDPNLKQTYMRQFIVSFDRELGREISVGMRYIYRRWNDIIDNQNISGHYIGVPFLNPITGETITVFNRIDNRDTEFLVTNPPDLFRQYDGFEITTEKRFSRNLLLSGSLVISRARGNIDNVNSSIRANDRLFNDPNFNINIDGKLVNDPTYQFKIFGAYQFQWGINSSFYFRHESGDTWTPLVRVTRLNQGAVNIFGVPRGSNRFDSIDILDLRVEKAFSTHDGQIRFTADIFNVFNTASVLDVNRLFEAPNFESPIDYTSPRQIRLGVRYTF